MVSLRQAHLRHARYYQAVLKTADALSLQGGEALQRGLDLFDTEWKNIQAGQSWAEGLAAEDDIAANLCLEYADFGARLLSLRSQQHQQIAWPEAALAAARRLRQLGSEGRFLDVLGAAYLSVGEPHRALEYLKQALAIAHAAKYRQGVSSVLGHLGHAYRDLGEPRRAIECYERAWSIAREVGDRRHEASMGQSLGNAYMDLGEHQRAIEYQEQALDTARQMGDLNLESAILINLTRAYTARALSFTRRSQGTNLGMFVPMLSLMAFRHNIENLEQALIIARQLGYRRREGNALHSLGATYVSVGEPRRAIECFEQALVIAQETGDRYSEGTTVHGLGGAYLSVGKPRRAIECFEQALVIAQETGDRYGEGNAMDGLSRVLDKIGARTQAIAHAEAALEIYEHIGNPIAAVSVRTRLTQWHRQRRYSMSWLKRLWRRKNQDPKLLQQRILAFLTTTTWAETRRVVETHPELLTDGVKVLRQWARKVKRVDPIDDRFLEDELTLLCRCSELGVEQAFAEAELRKHWNK